MGREEGEKNRDCEKSIQRLRGDGGIKRRTNDLRETSVGECKKGTRGKKMSTEKTTKRQIGKRTTEKGRQRTTEKGQTEK